VCLIGFVFDANCFWWRRFVKEDANNLGFWKDVQVGMLSILQKRMNVTVSCILSLSIWANIAVPFLNRSAQFNKFLVLHRVGITEKPPFASKSCKSSM
jgi:hypothetical protein